MTVVKVEDDAFESLSSACLAVKNASFCDGFRKIHLDMNRNQNANHRQDIVFSLWASCLPCGLMTQFDLASATVVFVCFGGFFLHKGLPQTHTSTQMCL